MATIYANWDLLQHPHSNHILPLHDFLDFLATPLFNSSHFSVFDPPSTILAPPIWYMKLILLAGDIIEMLCLQPSLYRLAPSQPKRLQSLINRSYPKAIKVSPRWYLYCNQQFCASSKVIITSNVAKCDQPWVTSHHRTHGSRIETKRSSLRSQIKGDQ